MTRTEDELAVLCGYKPAVGTSGKGLMRALIAIAKDDPRIFPAPLSERREDVAVLKLKAAHDAGLVAILLVDNWEHWVVSFGTLGNNVIHVADSDNTELILHYSPEELGRRWKGPGRSPFYGILV